MLLFTKQFILFTVVIKTTQGMIPEGVYEMQLQVVDDCYLSSTSAVTITVKNTVIMFMLHKFDQYHVVIKIEKKINNTVFIILKDVTMTWQKWGSKQALEKRKTSLSLMEVFSIALKCRVFRF